MQIRRPHEGGLRVGMRRCDESHKKFDRVANKEGQLGEMPEWMHVRGKAFWWVYQGTYDDLGKAFETFHKKAQAAGVRPAGPPGDVYICDPDDHRKDPERILTVLWIPLE